MRFSFSEEQEEFRSVVRRFMQAKSPTTAVRKLMETETGYDPEVWRALSGDLGLTAIHVPEEYGGAGFGVSELAIASEEMGRALLCAPFFASTVMAATAIVHGASDEQKRRLLPDVASGETIATLAVVDDGGGWEPSSVRMQAESRGGAYSLTGAKTHVLDGTVADLFVVAALLPDGHLGLFAVPGDAPGLTRQAQKAMDPTRKLARIDLENATAELLGEPGTGAGAYARTMDVALICLANEMVGGAERLREDALEYVAMRMQFGRTIASFQVTKHKSADMLLDVELAKSAAYYAAAAADEGDGDLSALASLAKAGASDVYIQTAIHAVQMHGGIGFTFDNDTHLWFKRAKSSEVFLGDAAHHRERMLQHWSS